MRPGTPPETAVRVYKRYLRLEPTHAEEYIAYLKAQVRLRRCMTQCDKLSSHTETRWLCCIVEDLGLGIRVICFQERAPLGMHFLYMPGIPEVDMDRAPVPKVK